MAGIAWSKRANRQLQAIRTYIADENPFAARRIFLRIVAACDSLERLPSRGRPITGGRRELTNVRPYVIRYRVKGDVVTILEVRHAARKPTEPYPTSRSRPSQ